MRYLATKNVPPKRMKAIGYADTIPIVPNDSRENRATNRRVEFLFVKPEADAGQNKSVGTEGNTP